jgi:hypothetical protein
MGKHTLTYFDFSLLTRGTTSTRFAWFSQLICSCVCRFLSFCLTPRTPCLLVEAGDGDTHKSTEKVIENHTWGSGKTTQQLLPRQIGSKDTAVWDFSRDVILSISTCETLSLLLKSFSQEITQFGSA